VSEIKTRIRESFPFTIPVYELVVSKKNMLASRKKFAALLNAQNPICLDLGGADSGKGSWTSIDMTQECDIFWDLRLPLPLPNSSVAKIYSSHLFEHLPYEQGQALIRESLRVLQPGGTFSICVPDSRIYIEAYLGIREVPSEFYAWTPAFNQTTAIDAVNYIAFMGGAHKYMFDQENLLHILSASGLVDVYARAFDPSLDRAERDYESLYAIGTKR